MQLYMVQNLQNENKALKGVVWSLNQVMGLMKNPYAWYFNDHKVLWYVGCEPC